jgi:ElaB/YqjD/DUF883 family membrane-anchored ribosome-binding protein
MVQAINETLGNAGGKITDAVGSGIEAARHMARRAGNAAEDALDDTRHTIRRRPVQIVLAGVGVGFIAGILVARALRRR